MRIYACVCDYLIPAWFIIYACVSLSLSLSLSNKISELTNTFVLINSIGDEYLTLHYLIVSRKIFYNQRIILPQI